MIEGKLGSFHFEKPFAVTYFTQEDAHSKSFSSISSKHSHFGILKILPLNENIYILGANFKLYEICCLTSYHSMKIETLQKHDSLELVLLERDDITKIKDLYGNENIQIAITQDELRLVVWSEWQYMLIPNIKPTESSMSRIAPTSSKKDSIRHIDIFELLSDELEADEILQGSEKCTLHTIGVGSYYTAFLTKSGELYINGLGVAWLNLTCIARPRKVVLHSINDPGTELKIKNITCCDKFILLLAENNELFVWGQLETQHYNQPTLVTLTDLPPKESNDDESDEFVRLITSNSSYAVLITNTNRVLGLGCCPNFFKKISTKKNVYPSSFLRELSTFTFTNCIAIECGRQHLLFLDDIAPHSGPKKNDKVDLEQSRKSNSFDQMIHNVSLSDALSRIDDMQGQLRLKEQIIKNQNQMIHELQSGKTNNMEIDYTLDDLSNDGDLNSDLSLEVTETYDL